MSETSNTPVGGELRGIFSRFFGAEPISFETIDTSRGEADFRNTFLITAAGGEKYVLKLAANDFTFPERIRVWQRTVEEYRALGYYCPRIFGDLNGEFPMIEYRGHTCAAYAEEFSKYRSFAERAGGDEELDGEPFFEEKWSMTAKIAAKKLDYTEYPSAYCLFETFCPGDEMDEVLENALDWKKTAFALPEEYHARAEKIWRVWSENRDRLRGVYHTLPTSVFQADLNPTNLLVSEDGGFAGVCDFNLAGRDVFLNYLMRENSPENIPAALGIAAKYYRFSEEEKAAALPLFRCLKPLWYSRLRELKQAGGDEGKIRLCLEKTEALLMGERDLARFMG